MKVYVLIEHHYYPEVDGQSEILGVYATRELAEKDAEEVEARTRDEEDIYGERAMEPIIEEYTVHEGES